MYKFYGAETAKVNAINKLYKGIDTPKDLYDALSNIWCIDTCAPRLRKNYSLDNKTLGQCSITAFVAQDIFGGDVCAVITPEGNTHCYNVVDGMMFDLTSEQFLEKAKDLVYDRTNKQDRNATNHFGNGEKKDRYEYIKKELSKLNLT